MQKVERKVERGKLGLEIQVDATVENRLALMIKSALILETPEVTRNFIGFVLKTANLFTGMENRKFFMMK